MLEGSVLIVAQRLEQRADLARSWHADRYSCVASGSVVSLGGLLRGDEREGAAASRGSATLIRDPEGVGGVSNKATALLSDEAPISELDEFRGLIAEGQERGFLTFEQIAACLEEVEVTKEQVAGAARLPRRAGDRGRRGGWQAGALGDRSVEARRPQPPPSRMRPAAPSRSRST